MSIMCPSGGWRAGVCGVLCAGFVGAVLAACAGCGGDTVLTQLFGAGLSVPPRLEGNSAAGTLAGDLADQIDTESCVAAGFPAEPTHIQIFNMINEHRVANGLEPVEYSFRLQSAADAYALRMYDEGFFGHVAPDGSEPADRALDAGFCNGFVGENIAYGRNRLSSADQVMQAFKNSPVHNDNMLEPRWRYVGVGYLRVVRLGTIESWWVQEFGLDPGN